MQLNKMISTRNFIIILCFSYTFSKSVSVGSRRFIDVPSSCAEGTALVHSGDCVRPFELIIKSSSTASTTEATTTTTAKKSHEPPLEHRRDHEHSDSGGHKKNKH